jgi:hypothetical protein
MRRPAGDEDHLESRAHASTRIGEPLRVDVCGAQEKAPRRGFAQPRGQRIGRTHRAQIAHQAKQVRVTHCHGLAIRHRQGEPGSLQKAAHVAHIRERRDARADPAVNLRLGHGERDTQLVQALATKEATEKEPIGFQNAAKLNERSGKIVEILQGKRRYGQIEAFRRQRQAFLIAHKAQERAIAGRFRQRRHADQKTRTKPVREPSGKPRRRRAGIEDGGKFPLDRGKPLAELFAGTD